MIRMWSQSYITTDGQSDSLFWCQAPIWDPKPIFPRLSLIIFRQLRVCWRGEPSLTRSRVCSLRMWSNYLGWTVTEYDKHRGVNKALRSASLKNTNPCPHPTLQINLSGYLRTHNLIIFRDGGEHISRCEELIFYYYYYLNVPTAGKCYFFPHPIFLPFWGSKQKKKIFPSLSMWSNSSTPLKVAVGGLGACGIHKSNFVCSVRSTELTDATKGKGEKNEKNLQRNLTCSLPFMSSSFKKKNK
jgi:hypothetical protein